MSTKFGEIYCYILFSNYSTIIRQNSLSTLLVERHATNFVAFPYKYSGKNDYTRDATYMSGRTEGVDINLNDILDNQTTSGADNWHNKLKTALCLVH